MSTKDKTFYPSYYSIIPSEVRYCKEITANEKLLYSEITCLCNALGFCVASNSYFSYLYSVSNITISRWISNLSKLRFIKVDIDKKNGNKRKIYLLTNMPIPINKNDNTPINKNAKYNNTSFNNNFNKPSIVECSSWVDEFYNKVINDEK